MPIYEYACKNCGNIFEEWCKKVSEAEESCICPNCGHDGQRLISNTSFALKGEGWYVTEYGNKKNTAGKTEATSEGTSGSAQNAPEKAVPSGEAKTTDANATCASIPAAGA